MFTLTQPAWPIFTVRRALEQHGSGELIPLGGNFLHSKRPPCELRGLQQPEARPALQPGAVLRISLCQVSSQVGPLTWALVDCDVTCRLTVPLAVYVFFVAALSDRITHGPLWDLTVIPEAAGCRSNWWAALLYVNNYVDDTIVSSFNVVK